MKTKYLIMVSLILAVLTIGAASASDDIGLGDVSASDESVEVDEIASPEDDGGVLADGDDPSPDPVDEREEVYPDVSFPDEVIAGEDYSINVYVYDKNVTGNVTIKIDNQTVYNEEIAPYSGYYDGESEMYVSSGGNEFSLNGLAFKQGSHDVEVSYAGDENYLPFTEYRTFEYTYMDIEMGDSTYEDGFDIFLANDATGNVEVLIDNRSFLNRTAEELAENRYVEFGKLSYGMHTVTVILTGDEKYEDLTLEHEFEYTYRFGVWREDDTDCDFLDTIPYYIAYFPDDADGEIIVSYNGNTTSYPVKGEEDSNIDLFLSGFKLGQNNISFTFKDPKYPEKTVNRTINIHARLHVPGTIRCMNEEDAIYVLLPEDAKGNLIISELTYVDGDENLTVLKNITVENGVAKVLMSDLEMGYHRLYAYYDGEDYNEYVMLDREEYDEYIGVYVIPDVQYESNIYCAVEHNVTIVLPDDGSDNLTVIFRSTDGVWNETSGDYDYDYSEELYDGVANGTVIVTIPVHEPGYYDLYISYGDTYNTYYIDSRNTTPDLDFEITFPSEITSDDNAIFISNIPEDLSGYFELYIDGENIAETLFENDNGNIDENVPYYLFYDTYGNHTWEIRFNSYGFYNNAARNGTFFKDWIDVPKRPFLDSIIEVQLEDKEGYINFIIDGEPYKSDVLNYGYASFSLDNLTFGNHDYEISYFDNNNTKILTKSGSFSLRYEISTNIDGSYLKMVEEFELLVYVPEDATGNVSVNVDGKEYVSEIINGTARFVLTDLTIGKNNVSVRYAGDKKYPSGEISDAILIEGYGITVKYSEIDEEFEFEYVYIMLPEDADGNLTLYKAHFEDEHIGVDEDGEYMIPARWVIDDETPVMSVRLVNGTATITKDDFDFGVYDFLARYVSPTEDYEVDDVGISFDKVPEINITEEIIFGENATISILIPGATGELEIYKIIGFDDEGEAIVELFANVTSDNGKFEKVISGLDFGEHDFYFVYPNAEDNIFNIHHTYSIYVSAINASIPEDFNADGSALITLVLPEGASGKVSVFVGLYGAEISGFTPVIENATYTSENKTILLTGIETGHHDIMVSYIDDKHGEFTFSNEITVPKPDASEEIVNPDNITTDELDLTLHENATGGVYVTIDGTTTYVPIVEGNAKVDLSGLDKGSHTISVKYPGDENFAGFEKTSTINIVDAPAVKVDPALTISVDNIVEGDVAVVKITTNATFTGIVKVAVGGKNISVEVKNGVGSANVSDLAAASYTAVATFAETEIFAASVKNATFTVSPKGSGDSNGTNTTVSPVIVAKDLTAYYNKVSYSVTVYGDDGNVAVGVEVVYKINGKKVGTAKTNDKGIATLKLKQLPKTYKITTEALGVNVTKKLKVKQVLTLKKVKVKKSAKKLVIKATLKEGKKALKKKTVTIKFKNKKFTVKTNKKGVAKVTIKKKILKKLKKGKKVTYSATYLKDTVKRTVKVKK